MAGRQGPLATTGFSKMSDRQVALGNINMTTIDQTSGVLMPFWTDNSILFLAGKGCVALPAGLLPTSRLRTHRDDNIRYYKHENDTMFPLAEYGRRTRSAGCACSCGAG